VACTITETIRRTYTQAIDLRETVYTPYTLVKTYTTTTYVYTATWRTTYDTVTVTSKTTRTITIQTTVVVDKTNYVTEEVVVEEPIFTKYVRTLFLVGKLLPTTIEVSRATTVVERVLL
jgi:hypothetical protein